MNVTVKVITIKIFEHVVLTLRTFKFNLIRYAMLYKIFLKTLSDN